MIAKEQIINIINNISKSKLYLLDDINPKEPYKENLFIAN